MRCFEFFHLPDTASPAEVKKAWHDRAMTLHPDHGGDPSAFHDAHELYREALHIATTRPCPECNGTRKVTVTQGWTRVQLACPICG